jgi:hypothetical protein
MKKRDMEVIKNAVRMLFLTMILLFGMSCTVWAGSSKAARIKGVFSSETKVNQMRGISFALPKTEKLAAQNKWSARVMFQKTLLEKEGNFLFIMPGLDLYKEHEYAGSLSSRMVVCVTRKKAGLKAYLIDLNAGLDASNAGDKVRIRTVGENVVVDIRNILMQKKLEGADGNEIEIKTGVKYRVIPTIWFFGGNNTKKNMTGYVYLDSFTLKASRACKVTFDKTDYYSLTGIKGNDKTFSARIVKVVS